MLLRLLAGLIKGLLVGGLVGYGLVYLGMGATPGPLLAYAAGAVAGVLVGLVAGKPIWAKDAKVEAGMKALVGAFLGAGLMWALRRWGQVPLPLGLGELGGPNASLEETAQTFSNGSLAGVGMTALAAVSALLGAFYDLDNTPSESSSPAARGEGARAPAQSAGQGDRARVGSGGLDADEEALPPGERGRARR